MTVVLVMHLSVSYLLLVVLLYLLQQVICTQLLPPAVRIQLSCTRHTQHYNHGKHKNITLAISLHAGRY